MTTTPKKVALYLRVSTADQTTVNQELELRRVAELRNWDIVAVFDDSGISGATTRDDRPGLDAMLKEAVKGRYDIVAVWKLDRLGRSTIDLINNADLLKNAGVELYCHSQGIDTTTPTGKLTFTLLAAIAEYERETIRDRVLAGLARARAQGKTFGRPRVSPEKEAEIRHHLSTGLGMNKVVTLTGVGKATVQRIKKEMHQ